MASWKAAGKTALSIGYFITLLLIFTFIAIQGPIVVAKAGPSAASILRDSLLPFSIADLGLEGNQIFGMIDFYFMVVFGFISSYMMGRTFQKIFDSGTLTTLFVTLIFLSPYYSPLVFGVHIINSGYAYPVFLLTIRYLLEGLVFRSFPAYMKFFLFSAIAVILRRQFIFLPVIGIVSVAYSLIFDYEDYFGKKIYMIIALMTSIILPDLSERYKNYTQIGQFISVPFAGFQFAVTPLYVSKEGDGQIMNSQTIVDLYSALRQPLIDEGLLEGNNVTDETPLMLKYRNFFEIYNTIAYEKIRPLIQQAAQGNPGLVDTGLIAISLGLIMANFGDYFMVFIHNIIYHMGGYFMAGLMLLIFITSFVYHVQHRGRFSLVALIVTFMGFSNYILVALLEPVTQEYAFYTDAFSQALLVALISFLFRSQKGKQRVDEYEDGKSIWKGVEKPR